MAGLLAWRGLGCFRFLVLFISLAGASSVGRVSKYSLNGTVRSAEGSERSEPRSTTSPPVMRRSGQSHHRAERDLEENTNVIRKTGDSRATSSLPARDQDDLVQPNVSHHRRRRNEDGFAEQSQHCEVNRHWSFSNSPAADHVCVDIRGRENKGMGLNFRQVDTSPWCEVEEKRRTFLSFRVFIYKPRSPVICSARAGRYYRHRHIWLTDQKTRIFAVIVPADYRNVWSCLRHILYRGRHYSIPYLPRVHLDKDGRSKLRECMEKVQHYKSEYNGRLHQEFEVTDFFSMTPNSTCYRSEQEMGYKVQATRPIKIEPSPDLKKMVHEGTDLLKVKLYIKFDHRTILQLCSLTYNVRACY